MELELDTLWDEAARIGGSIRFLCDALDKYLVHLDPDDMSTVQYICSELRREQEALTEIKTLLGSLYKEKVLENVTLH